MLGWLFTLLFAVHLLVAAVSLPLIRRRVAPNPLYGFRTPKTLSDERIWYAANAVAGRWLLGAAAVSAALAPVLFNVLPARDAIFASFGILTAALLVAAVASFVALSRMD